MRQDDGPCSDALKEKTLEHSRTKSLKARNIMQFWKHIKKYELVLKIYTALGCELEGGKFALHTYSVTDT